MSTRWTATGESQRCGQRGDHHGQRSQISSRTSPPRSRRRTPSAGRNHACRPCCLRPRPRRSPTVTRALTLSTDSVTSSWRRMLTRVGWRRGSNGRRQHGAGLAIRQRGHPQQTEPIVPVNMDSGTDREQRRLLRVRRELEKIQEVNEEEAVRKEQEKQEQHDLVEFAENYFNDHERSPSGTIVGTIKRSKTMEILPKSQMLKFYKGSSIPNSHIHMFDPKNVNLACNIFK